MEFRRVLFRSARCGEQDLLDQVAQVVVRIRRGRASPPVHVVREVDVRHVASTRTWAESGSIGVPDATHVEVPVIVATGTPPASTRTAPVSHWPVTHTSEAHTAELHATS